MRKSTAAPINWTLSLSRPDKLDQLLHIVEGVIVAADPFAMIHKTRFFVPCKAVQKLRLSVSFYKYRKSIWLDFRQQSFSACRFTVVTVCILFLNGTFSILAPIFIRTIVGAATTAMVVFRAKAARQATSCNSKFSFHACPPLNSVFPHPLHIQNRIRIAFLVKL